MDKFFLEFSDVLLLNFIFISQLLQLGVSVFNLLFLFFNSKVQMFLFVLELIDLT